MSIEPNVFSSKYHINIHKKNRINMLYNRSHPGVHDEKQLRFFVGIKLASSTV